jgi:hypothetical protein
LINIIFSRLFNVDFLDDENFLKPIATQLSSRSQVDFFSEVTCINLLGEYLGSNSGLLITDNRLRTDNQENDVVIITQRLTERKYIQRKSQKIPTGGLKLKAIHGFRCWSLPEISSGLSLRSAQLNVLNNSEQRVS